MYRSALIPAWLSLVFLKSMIIIAVVVPMITYDGSESMLFIYLLAFIFPCIFFIIAYVILLLKVGSKFIAGPISAVFFFVGLILAIYDYIYYMTHMDDANDKEGEMIFGVLMTIAVISVAFLISYTIFMIQFFMSFYK